MRLLDFIFGKSRQGKHQEQQESKLERQINIADNASTIDNLSSGKDYALIVFSADWCGPSRKFKPLLEATGLQFQVIDVDENTVVTERMKIRSVPTTILVNRKGEELKRWIGFDEDDPNLSEIVDYIITQNINLFADGVKVMNRKLQNDSIIQDFRASFYALEDIKVMSMGESWQIAPYDAFWYFQYPDADILPSLTNTTKIKKFLPGLGFDDINGAKKRLEGFMLKVEAQMGVTYVIRNKNIPMGMIFVNSPLYNKRTINLSIWTVDFFINEMAEHKGVMFQSLIRVLNEMKMSMGAQNVYAMVDENNIDCIKLIGNGLFAKVDNAGFANNAMGGKKPLVYMIDLTRTKFEK